MSFPGITHNPPVSTLPFGYSHTVEYFEKGIDSQGPHFKVRYIIADWGNADAMVNALMGYADISGGVTSGTVTKRAPHQHPLSSNLYCRSAIAKGVGPPVINSAGLPSYAGGALIECEYRPMTSMAFTITPQEQAIQIDQSTPLLYCTQEVHLTTDEIAIPGYHLTFQGTVRNAPNLYVMYYPVADLNLTFHQLPYNAWAGPCRTLRGKVNNATFLGAAASCVLFRGADIVRDWDPSGNATTKMQLRFAERPVDKHWNMLPDPRDGAFGWKVVVGAGGAVPHAAADLSPLVDF